MWSHSQTLRRLARAVFSRRGSFAGSSLAGVRQKKVGAWVEEVAASLLLMEAAALEELHLKKFHLGGRPDP